MTIIFDTVYIEMGPYYRVITSTSSLLPLDQSLLDSMEKDNAEELKKLDDRLAEAEKIEGESEISDALKARANYLTRIGDKVPVSLLVWSNF
jgi:26S proteasome regulatory subunit N7